MPESDDQEDLMLRVDASMRAWRQGDCCLEQQWFLHRFDPSKPITDAARQALDDGVDIVEQAFGGLVVLTQTCDVVRSCSSRPFEEVAPLIEVDEDHLRQIERGRRPGYAFVPGVADHRLVADLDRVMTVEKPVVAAWTRVPGCSTDDEVRRFAWALARKRSRFAYPDDFTRFAGKLHDRLKKKHDKDSDEGRALAGLDEIRVQASPSWSAEQVELMFWFIRGPGDLEFESETWPGLLERWLGLVPDAGRFGPVYGQICSLDDLSATDLRCSDLLDLDRLSLAD